MTFYAKNPFTMRVKPKHNTPWGSCVSMAESVISYLAGQGFDPFLLKKLIQMSLGKSSLRSTEKITTEADAVFPLEFRENNLSTKEPSQPPKMDLNAEFDRVIEGMDWEDLVSSLEDTLVNILDDPSPPTCASLPSSTALAGLEVNTHIQPAEGEGVQFAENTFLEDALDFFDLLSPMASPHASFQTLPKKDIMEPDNMNEGSDQFSFEQCLPSHSFVNEASTSSASAAICPPAPPQQQYLPYDSTVYTPTSLAHAEFSPLAAPPPQQQYIEEPLRTSASLYQNLQPAGVLLGDIQSQVPEANFPTTSSAAPLPSTCNSRKRPLEETQQDDQPYIKKPPNAFMLFMKEQRPNVPADIKDKGSAATDAFLGQRWNSLTCEQKSDYFKLAEVERNLHNALHPDWTGSNNYCLPSDSFVNEASTSSASAAICPPAPPQQQYLPYDSTVYTPTSLAHAEFSPLAAPPPQQQYIEEPLRTSASLYQNLQPAGVLVGDIQSQVPEANFPTTSSAAPLPSTCNSRKRPLEETQQDDQPYIKKPPNAFMLFMKEQRPNVPADIKDKGSAATNAFLGQRWNSLTREQKSDYFKLAEVERNLHNARHPDWTGSNNYGKKMKRVRRKPYTGTEGVMEPSREQTDVTAPNPLQTVGMMPHPAQLVLQEPHSETPMIEPGPSQLVLQKLHTGLPSFEQPLDSHKTLMVEVSDLSTGAKSAIELQPLKSIFLPQPEMDAGVMEPNPFEPVLVQIPETQAPLPTPRCQSCYFPRVFEVISWLQRDETTSTSSNAPRM